MISDEKKFKNWKKLKKKNYESRKIGDIMDTV
jgi:hypothetical protein